MHMVAGFIILCAIVTNMIDINKEGKKEGATDYLQYALLFLLSSFFDVMSHALKESIVRS